jgi:predicted ArsR family transcriptional regulator
VTRTLARRLRLTVEGTRLLLGRLTDAGLVYELPPAEPARKRRGRPAARYALTAAGLEALPKAYAEMTLGVVDAVAAGLGPDALRTVLGALTDARVAALRPRVDGLPFEERLRALRAIYRTDDAFLKVERDGDRWRLTERNCPFLRVALARPAVCSTTVTTLSRLLGCRVERDLRFQSGDGCCSFLVDPARAADGPVSGFAEEPALAAGGAGGGTT